MAPEWTNQIPNYAICNFFYFFYVVYAVIFAFAVLQVVYIFAVVKKFDLMNGIMLGSGLFTMALALVLTLFHYLVCDRALINKAIYDVEGFYNRKSTTEIKQGTKAASAQLDRKPPGKAPVTCPPGCVAAK